MEHSASYSDCVLADQLPTTAGNILVRIEAQRSIDAILPLTPFTRIDSVEPLQRSRDSATLLLSAHFSSSSSSNGRRYKVVVLLIDFFGLGQSAIVSVHCSVYTVYAAYM